MKHYTINSTGIVSIDMGSFVINKTFNWQSFVNELEDIYDKKQNKEELKLKFKHFQTLFNACHMYTKGFKEESERKQQNLIKKIIYFTYNELLYYSAMEDNEENKDKGYKLDDIKNISSEDLQAHISKFGIKHKTFFSSCDEKDVDIILHEIVDERLIKDI